MKIALYTFDMNNLKIIIIHSDHNFDPLGINSGAENATFSLSLALNNILNK